MLRPRLTQVVTTPRVTTERVSWVTGLPAVARPPAAVHATRAVAATRVVVATCVVVAVRVRHAASVAVPRVRAV
jgi:hypothetical protein